MARCVRVILQSLRCPATTPPAARTECRSKVCGDVISNNEPHRLVEAEAAAAASTERVAALTAENERLTAAMQARQTLWCTQNPVFPWYHNH